jgi:hypothetical protein
MRGSLSDKNLMSQTLKKYQAENNLYYQIQTLIKTNNITVKDYLTLIQEFK